MADRGQLLLLAFGLALATLAGAAALGLERETAGASTASAYATTVLGAGPVAYWRLGETSGTTAADQRGAHPGTYRNGVALGQPGALAGDGDPAIRLDGTNDHVTVASAPALDTRSAFTLEAWVRPTALPKGNGTMALLTRSGQYSLRVGSNGAVLLRAWRNGRAKEHKSASGALVAGTWRHVAATYDGATMAIRVDGVQSGGTTAQPGPLDASSSTLHLGTNGTLGEWLSATVDEVAVYDRALPATRIQDHHQVGTTDPHRPDTIPPEVTLAQPPAGAVLASPLPTFSGAAGTEDGDEQEVRVRVYSGGSASGQPVQVLATNRSGSTWQVGAQQPLADGTYTARAEQSDAAGNVGLSDPRTFTIAVPDTAPPAVTLTEPASGATLTDPKPTFSGNAGNAAGDLDQVTVKVYSGGSAVGTPVQTLTTSRSGASWQVTASQPLADGTYTARAEQSDATGNIGLSESRTFAVAAPIPEPPPPDPPPDPPPAPGYSPTVMADGPRAYWRLGEGSGIVAASQTGAHNGVYENGPVLGRPGALPGDTDTAVTFSGIAPQVRVPNATGLQTSSFALETWVNAGALPEYTSTLIRKSGQYLLRLRHDGALTLVAWKGGAASPELRTAPGTIAPGTWHHVVANHHGGELSIWVDGQKAAAAPLAGPLDSSSSTLYLASSGGYDWFTGTLDEVAVYPQGLSGGRIAAHLAAASVGDTTPPAVTLTQPTAGATLSDPRPTFAGAAGNESGDDETVSVNVYAGSSAAGTPVQTLTTTRSGASWSATAAQPLADGTYTARARQSDAAGNVGLSGSRTFTIAQPAVPSYRNVVLADQPRGYWRLGEASGTTATSQTGAHHGFYEAAPALGRPGVVGGDPDTAAGFNGTGAQVRVPNAAGLQTGAFSLEAWVNAAAMPDYTATLVRKSGQYQLRLRYDGALTLVAWKGGSPSTELRTGVGAVKRDAWHHVVATHDGAELSIWVDGQKQAATPLAGPLSTSTSALYLASSGGYDWASGTVDEVAVYPHALTPARITAHYERAYLIDETPPSIALKTPTPGSTMQATTNFGGRAGTVLGDSGTVTLRIWSGTSASGAPIRQFDTLRRAPSGSFSTLLSPPLASGTYTARAEQRDAAGNVGESTPVTFSVDASAPPSLLAAGDVAHCAQTTHDATAEVLDRLPGTVAMLGDAAYEYGTPEDFANCYDRSWGRHLARTRPIPGDHDYDTPNAAGYFGYFGAAAGDPDKGYYSFDLGSWHVVALNSVCYERGWCSAAMETWLESDLAASSATCTVGLLHEPRFSSGSIHGPNPGVEWLWQIMYDAGVDVVLSGSEHIYERFAKQTPRGAADPARGIRQFIAGTGGRTLYGIGTVQPNSEVRHAGAHGILKLDLRPGSYAWEFVPEAGKSFTDTGTTACH